MVIQDTPKGVHRQTGVQNKWNRQKTTHASFHFTSRHCRQYSTLEDANKHQTMSITSYTHVFGKLARRRVILDSNANADQINPSTPFFRHRAIFFVLWSNRNRPFNILSTSVQGIGPPMLLVSSLCSRPTVTSSPPSPCTSSTCRLQEFTAIIQAAFAARAARSEKYNKKNNMGHGKTDACMKVTIVKNRYAY